MRLPRAAEELVGAVIRAPRCHPECFTFILSEGKDLALPAQSKRREEPLHLENQGNAQALRLRIVRVPVGPSSRPKARP